MFRYILFDLDGTLTDPKEGICKSVQYALSKFDINEPDLDNLTQFIGPPLTDSFKKYYDMDDKQCKEAVSFYRERFSTVGLYENKLYPGIPELLDTLKDKGAFIAIASSKPTVFIEKILKYFHIDQYFDVVVGSELDGTRGKKEEVVKEALQRLKQLDLASAHEIDGFNVNDDGTPRVDLIYDTTLDYTNTAMVGDRHFDIHGAKEFGIYPIGVSYGYAEKGELKAAGASSIVKDTKSLLKVLLTCDGRKEPKERAIEKPYSLEDLTYRKELPTLSILRAVYMIVPVALFFALRYGLSVLFIKILHLDEAIQKMFQSNHFYDVFSFADILSRVSAVLNILLLILIGGFLVLLFRKSDPTRIKINKGCERYFLYAGVIGLFGAKALNLLISYIGSGFPQIAKIYESASYHGTLPFALGLVNYVLLTPIVEEIVFRWLFYGRVRRALGVKVAMICSALVFGIYHGNLVQAIYAFLMGLALCYFYEKSGSILSSIIFHACANFVIFALAYVPQNISSALNSLPGFVFWFLGTAVSVKLLLGYEKKYR